MSLTLIYSNVHISTWDTWKWRKYSCDDIFRKPCNLQCYVLHCLWRKDKNIRQTEKTAMFCLTWQMQWSLSKRYFSGITSIANFFFIWSYKIQSQHQLKHNSKWECRKESTHESDILRFYLCFVWVVEKSPQWHVSLQTHFV